MQKGAAMACSRDMTVMPSRGRLGGGVGWDDVVADADVDAEVEIKRLD